MSPDLHIIALDNPYPPDYGGSIEMYYKLKALKELGIKVDLHVFVYGRNQTGPLKKLVSSLSIYNRKKNPLFLFSALPYLVKSRMDGRLRNFLSNTTKPVLFEGIHTTGWIHQTQAKKILRLHNIEQRYYKKLSYWETGLLKKFYLKKEAGKLEIYEPHVWQQADTLLFIHPSEKRYLPANKNTDWLPPFHAFDTPQYRKVRENYVLFHGNFNVAENKKSAMDIYEKMLEIEDIPYLIAGKNAAKLRAWANNKKRIKIVNNPSDKELEEYITKAKVNIIHSPQNTGFKIKLLHALFRSPGLLVSRHLVEETPLLDVVNSFQNWEEGKYLIKHLWRSEKDDKIMLNRRLEILKTYFDNQTNARKLMEYVRK